jgi:preprotein translocase subunit SecD
MGIIQRVLVVVVLVLLSLGFVAPTINNDFFREMTWFSKPISLGLDLRGGVHLVYEVQTKEAVKSKLVGMGNGIRSELREKKIPVVRTGVVGDNQLEVTLLNQNSEEAARNLVVSTYPQLSFVERGIDSSGRPKFLFSLSTVESSRIEDESVLQAIETLRNRIDQFGVAEPLLQRVGEKRIQLQMPGETDSTKVKNLVGKVAKLEFRLAPASPTQSNVVTIKDQLNNPVKVEDQALLTGEAIKDANFSFVDGKFAVDLKFTTKGASDFGKITSENVGRLLSIILDGVEYSRPVIREPIRDGNCQISGSFTKEEARTLRFVLRSGALPAPLGLMEERTVGPTLGQESIEKGILAMLVGCAAIALFMVVYYKKSGVIAVATLILNLLLMLAALSAFGATLTLPGLAGLALTIGMAVDANVLIFERIRDELRNGSSRDAAVRAGFDKAFTAILDSNVTTFISGAILFYFGTGSIRGFAVTLCIGIVTTVFSATFAARLGFEALTLDKSDTLSI